MLFNELPETSRLKIFHASRPLSESESALLRKEADFFLKGWQTHKQDLTAAYEWKYHQFLLVGIDERCVSLSGCSIDRLTQFVEALGRQFQVEFLNSPQICYRNEQNQICCVDRLEFKNQIQLGAIHENTLVFNNLIMSLKEWRAGKWEVPLKESWHAQAFPLNKFVSVKS
ncbi:MAG: hypothetical protein AABZ60_07790 [Planctomycetota bacterium]